VSNPGGDASGYYGGNGQDYSGYNQQSIYPPENNSNTGVALSLFTINSTIIMEMALQTTLAITSNNSSNRISLILLETMAAMMAELDIRERTFTRKKSR
jgi:hypothetical protein